MKKNFTRRQFLKSAACGGLYGAASMAGLGALGAKPAFGLGPTGKIVVFIHCDIDWLNALTPTNAAFRNRRPRVAHPDGNLDGTIITSAGKITRRFHNSLSGLATMYQNNELAVVQGVGFSERTLTKRRSLDLWGRGVDRPDHPAQDGWAQRLAASAGYTSPKKIIDLTGGNHPALQGGSYVPLTSEEILTHDDIENQGEANDSEARDIAVWASGRDFEQNSPLAARYADNLDKSMSVTLDIRANPGTAGYPGAGPESSDQGASNSFNPGVTFDSIDRLLSARYPNNNFRFTSDVEVIFAKIEGYGGLDQRDIEQTFLDELEDSIVNFAARMDSVVIGATTVWDNLIVILCPYFGRTFATHGALPADDDDNNGDYLATGPGWATDYIMFGGGVRGGLLYGTLTDQQLTNDVDATAFTSPVQIIHGAIEGLGRSGNAVIDLEGKGSFQPWN